ncbi:hypothetical protein ABFS83_06G094300 [Erythranthe nasuta]
MKPAALILILILILLITIPPYTESKKQGTKFLDKTTVAIYNDINEDDSSISVHCYSVNGDLGTHQLTYGTNFTWTFREDIWGMTKYYCDFVTEYGSGNYGVFTPKLRIRCDTFCPWSITDTGPCLEQTAYGHELWCQGWKIPHPPPPALP